jgi:hypothetical protein
VGGYEMKIKWQMIWLNIIVIFLIRKVPIMSKKITATTCISSIMQLKDRLSAMGYYRWQIHDIVHEELPAYLRKNSNVYEKSIIEILEKHVQFAEKCKSIK